MIGGSVYDAPLDRVWEFVGSGNSHSLAHRHRRIRRDLLSPNQGEYSWEQELDGAPTRFMMRWVSYHPVGVAYDVVDGPFAGSRFFLYDTPQGVRTEVGVVGEFQSPTLPEGEIRAAVDRFFALEFEQDSLAMANPARG
jgi:hypothetical protein